MWPDALHGAQWVVPSSGVASVAMELSSVGARAPSVGGPTYLCSECTISAFLPKEREGADACSQVDEGSKTRESTKC